MVIMVLIKLRSSQALCQSNPIQSQAWVVLLTQIDQDWRSEAGGLGWRKMEDWSEVWSFFSFEQLIIVMILSMLIIIFFLMIIIIMILKGGGGLIGGLISIFMMNNWSPSLYCWCWLSYFSWWWFFVNIFMVMRSWSQVWSIFKDSIIL